MVRTKKQWHRYFIKEISMIVSKYVDKNKDFFVECGVKQGSSSVIMASNLNIDGYLFDTWQGFPHFTDIDLDLGINKAKDSMEYRIRVAKNTYKECVDNLTSHGVIDLCQMMQGDILKIVPKFIENLEDFNISMMHIDTDLYEPAKVSLESFWPYVKESGVVYFHDYEDKKWRGIKKVVDKLVEIDKNLYFHIFDANKLFSACVVKGKSNASEDIFNNIVSFDR